MIASRRGRPRGLISKATLKAALQPALDFLPDRGRALKHLRWRLYLAYWNRANGRRRGGELATTYHNRIYWIDTDRIQHVTERPRDFHSIADRGRVLEGDWDLSRTRFDSLPIYVSARERVHHGRPWHETAYHASLLARIVAGDAPYGFRSREDLDRRCRSLDQLIQSMRERGCRPSAEVELAGEDKNPLQRDEDIFCNIDRHGRYLFHDGQHRLAIAKVLGIERVPVKILVRHRDWQNLRNSLYHLAEKESGSLYQPAVHPDLQEIPYHHTCEDRLKAIQSRLISSKFTTLLDVGANLCYFCHHFEELGYACTAVESDPVVSDLADKIRISQDKKFRLIADDLFYVDRSIQGQSFDVMLAMNIFHHFLKREDTYGKLLSWLRIRRGKIGTVFFEPHNPTEKQMKDAYRNYLPDEFTDFIKANLALAKSVRIQDAADDRQVFMLYND